MNVSSVQKQTKNAEKPKRSLFLGELCCRCIHFWKHIHASECGARIYNMATRPESLLCSIIHSKKPIKIHEYILHRPRWILLSIQGADMDTSSLIKEFYFVYVYKIQLLEEKL